SYPCEPVASQRNRIGDRLIFRHPSVGIGDDMLPQFGSARAAVMSVAGRANRSLGESRGAGWERQDMRRAGGRAGFGRSSSVGEWVGEMGTLTTARDARRRAMNPFIGTSSR